MNERDYYLQIGEVEEVGYDLTFTDTISGEINVAAEFGGQGNNKQPRPKIKGSQYVKRQEKGQVKQMMIKNLFNRKK